MSMVNGRVALDDAAPEKPVEDRPQNSASRFRARLRKNRFWLIVGGIFLLVAAFALVNVLNGSRASTVEISAANPAPAGAMAAAELLSRNGVRLTQTDNLNSTLEALRGSGAGQSTVLLYDPKGFLDAEQAASLAASGARVVAIAPGPLTLAALTPEIRSAGRFSAKSDQKPLPAQCRDTTAEAAAAIDPGPSNLYTGGTVCFSPPDTTGVRSGILAQSQDGRFTAAGSAALFSNSRLDKEGNAALVLRLLGRDPNLVWYLPSAKDIVSGENQPTLSDLQPTWLAPLSLWLLFVGLLAMFWRGRRDGPLVEEPLPVSVKAAETALGRARLYQDGRAVARAADNLRSASLNRLASRFRLGRDATAEAIVLAVLAHSPRAENEVREILQQTRPTSERQFLVWSQQLETLEREIERES